MTNNAEPLVRYSVTDRISMIELNRPERLNAINDEMTRAMRVAFDALDQDTAADVAVVHGAGRAFSSGADVQQSQLLSREDMENSEDPLGLRHPFAELLYRSRHCKPVIACVHGYALGMALGFVLDCDLIVAEEGTRLQVTETPRGLGGYRHWARMKARGAGMFADEVCLTGRLFTAEEAHGAGLVTRLVPKSRGLETALELARDLARNPPLSVRETVRVRRWHASRLIRDIAFQTDALKLHLTEDFAEAVQAFAEKRRPGPFKAR